MATELAGDVAMMLALDIDQWKHSLGRWEDDATTAGLLARRLAVAATAEHLRAGHDVVIGQYLARTAFIEELEQLADRCGAKFCEFVLDIDEATLADRLRIRGVAPDRPEHAVNNRYVGPDDAARLVTSLLALRSSRPGAVWIDARGRLADTVAAVRSLLAGPEAARP